MVDLISRKEAKEQELKTYFTGKPCCKGHVCWRRVVSSVCLECEVDFQKEYRKDNFVKLREYGKRHYKNNLEKYAERRRNWYQRNRDRCAVSTKNWKENNLDKLEIIRRKWLENNQDKTAKYKRKWKKNNSNKILEYHKQKYNSDVNYKLSMLLRGRLRISIKQNIRAGSAVRDLGCSINEFKVHIENQFQSGMSWDNWGPRTWHLDHIRPLASFDLTDQNQFLEACHYTNLQPLFAKDNLCKGAFFLTKQKI